MDTFRHNYTSVYDKQFVTALYINIQKVSYNKTRDKFASKNILIAYSKAVSFV